MLDGFTVTGGYADGTDGTGDNNAPGLPATDIEGYARIVGTTVDMGAYEYWYYFVVLRAGGRTDHTKITLLK